MSQNFTGDSYDSSHVAATDLQNMEDNFAALKSQFSGTSAPSNPVLGMPWVDTTNNILKMYDGTQWVNVFNYSTGEFYIGTGFITAAMIADAARKPSLVAGETITPLNCNPTNLNVTNITGLRLLIATADGDSKTGVTSWSLVSPGYYVYIPGGTQTVRASFYFNNSSGSYASYARYKIGGLASGSVSTSNPGTWRHDVTVDVSSLSAGRYLLQFEMFSDLSSINAYINHASFWAE